MDRLFEGFFGSPAIASARTTGSSCAPPLDAWEEDGAFVVEVDTPGFKDEDIEITFDDDVLTIRGSRETRSEESTETLHRRERWTGSFERRLRLSAPIDADNVEAQLARGVLTITLPKAASAYPKRIPVSDASA